MSPTSRTSAEIIAEALEHFDIAIRHSERDLSDQIVIDAISMRLSAGVEALGALDPDTRTRLLGSQWPKMRGMLNRIAHDYGFIDNAIVQQTVLVNLPPIIEALRAWEETGSTR
ncbi:HepT-like ribonuclease domain-containing protein [Actinomyces viscosus]|uniref:HepT-like ribonuclease domain-containing protein n=1 Tax=Actinomyces viscosus TaxID=1656 RepID=UPI0028ED89AC|nr:HepT-like ribonuclease domain-containing protein [Actinomyces viscosus]